MYICFKAKNIFIKTLSIILPCFNPPTKWEIEILENYKSIENLLNNFKIHWFIVDDGSHSKTIKQEVTYLKQKIKNLTFIPIESNMGKGYAIRYALQLTETDYYIYTDIDVPYKNENFYDFMLELEKGTDLVLASRNEKYYNQISKSRTYISKIFKSAIKLFFRIPTSDTQAGLKGFSNKGKKVLLQTKINRFLFDLEFIKLASKEGLQITNIPVELKPNIVLSNVNYKILFKEFFNLIKILFK